MSDSPHTLLIGVDGGGSRCRVAIGTAEDGLLEEAEGGPANPNSDFDQAISMIRQTTHRAADKAGIDASALCGATAHLGLAGVLSAEDGQKVAAALPFARSLVTDDRMTTLVGALGSEDGFVAAIGTGSFIGGRQAGHTRFLGGWGFPIGDQASGAWLARAALAQVLESHDGVRPPGPMTQNLFARFDNDAQVLCRFSFAASPRDYAKLAPEIVAAARAGDADASALMQAGADYINAGLAALGYSADTPLCLTGGLGTHYAPWLPKSLQSQLRRPDGTALDGAFRLAADAARTGVCIS